MSRSAPCALICRKKPSSNDLRSHHQAFRREGVGHAAKRCSERVLARLLALEENPRPPGVKKLQGQESYRLRAGDYRILYTIDDESKKVMVLAIGNRREVYR